MSAAIASELTCKELVELVTDYFEDRLSLDENRRFELHVCSCTGCRAYLAQMRAVVRAAGTSCGSSSWRTPWCGLPSSSSRRGAAWWTAS